MVYADVFDTGRVPDTNQGYLVLPAKWEYDGTTEDATSLVSLTA